MRKKLFPHIVLQLFVNFEQVFFCILWIRVIKHFNTLFCSINREHYSVCCRPDFMITCYNWVTLFHKEQIQLSRHFTRDGPSVVPGVRKGALELPPVSVCLLLPDTAALTSREIENIFPTAQLTSSPNILTLHLDSHHICLNDYRHFNTFGTKWNHCVDAP